MKMYAEYKLWVIDDVRKSNPEVKTITIKAESPTDALERFLKSCPPYTGVYIK